MARSIIMPRFGMTQEDATIVRWIKHEGDRVESGDPICEVTTDKVNMEVEAPADGILAGLQYPEGETVPVTAVIAYLLAEGETLPEVGKDPGSTGAEVIAEQGEAGVSATSPKPARATPLARRMASAQQVDISAVQGSGRAGQVTRQDIEQHLAGRSDSPATGAGKVPGAKTPGARPPASPAARRLAKQAGIDLAQVSGSGPGGRVQGWDVQTAQGAAEGVLHPLPLQPLSVPLEGIRRTIAQRMQASWQTIPHIQFGLEVDMSRAIAMREQFNLRLGGLQSVSLTAVLIKACAAALRQHPALNCYLRDDQIWRLPEVNIGVAVALEEGLIVPVVRDADQKGLVSIAQEVTELSNKARQGNLRPQDVMEGTFTISNLGMFGIDHFTAIINPPQVGILAVGRVADRFVPDEARQPILRPVMAMTLSADHRAVDGAEAARFMSTLRGVLETAGVQWG